MNRLHLKIQDAGVVVGAEVLGQVKLPLSDIMKGTKVQQGFELLDKAGKPVYHSERSSFKSMLFVAVRFQSVAAIDKVPQTLHVAFVNEGKTDGLVGFRLLRF